MLAGGHQRSRLERALLALALCAACQAPPADGTREAPIAADRDPWAASVGIPWTRFGGPNRDFGVPDAGLSADWPRGGPRRLWERELGPGYSGIVVDGDGLYTMFRDDSEEVVVRLDVRNGETVWEHRYPAPLDPVHDPDYGDGPNSTPLLEDGRLYTIGVAGLLRCLDAETGELSWSHDLWRRLGGTRLELGYASSAIPYGDTIIALVGGEGRGAVAFDRTDGRILWKNLSFDNSFSTPTIMNLLGEDHLVVFMDTEVVGADPRTGEYRWHYSIRNQYPQNICQPIRLGDDRVFISTMEAGSRGLEISKSDDGYEVRELWSSRKLQCFYGSMVLLGDHVYGPSGYSAAPLLVALDARTGELAWRKRGFSVTNLIRVGSRIVILDAEGTLALATAGPDDLEIHAEAEVLRAPSLTPPTIVGTVLYARDQDKIVALDLGV